MSLAGSFAIECEQYASLQYSFVYTANGVPVDLTGCTADLQVRASPTDGTVVLELSTGNGRITLGGVLGTITLFVDAATTGALIPNTDPGYVYDLVLTYPSGVKQRLLEGAFAVEPGVTH